MRIPGSIAGLIAFGLTLNSTGFASDDALVVLKGESSNSAVALHGLLSGAERGVCTLTHSGFIQTQSYDLDPLLITKCQLFRSYCSYPGC